MMSAGNLLEPQLVFRHLQFSLRMSPDSVLKGWLPLANLPQTAATTFLRLLRAVHSASDPLDRVAVAEGTLSFTSSP